MTPLRVALLGVGNVGAGVAKLLLEHSDRVARRAGRPIELRRVVVRDLHKPRGVILPAGIVGNDYRRGVLSGIP